MSLAPRASCRRCGRPTYDPDKRERPWARGVSRGRQVLICPACQEVDPAWASDLERCDRCGETRLSAMLGEVVCRSCGTLQTSRPTSGGSDMAGPDGGTETGA